MLKVADSPVQYPTAHDAVPYHFFQMKVDQSLKGKPV